MSFDFILPNPFTALFRGKMSSIPSISAADPQVSKILSIIAAYRHRSQNVPDRFSKFLPQLEKQLDKIVAKGEPVEFILPGFPFKAPAEGKKSKTLGQLPDKTEEIALHTLDGLADSIAEIYKPGSNVIIVSDASVYGDLLQVSDADAYAYQTELRELASSLGLKHLKFVRAGPLSGAVEKDAQTLEQFSAQVRKTRRELDTTYAEEVDTSKDENIKATSKHYDTALPTKQDPAAFKAEMLKRGKAFAKLIEQTSSSYIRLSIHESNNVGKITIDLFTPGTNPSFLTPWHAAVAVMADASVQILDAPKIDKSKFYTQTSASGRPWLLRERSDLFNWGSMKLDFEPLYPCGMIVKPQPGIKPYKFEDVDMKHVRRLALSTAPLLLRGFTMEVQKEVFRAKANELGEIQMWPFGDIIEIRENPGMNMNNVLTNEAMPFHYDGVFKTVKDEKTGEAISVPPLFQMFRNRSAAQQVGGLTLFSSSRNMIPLLGPDTIPLSELRKLKWKTFTAANPQFGGAELVLPFISPHPETGVDTFRFHEPWPAEKCIGATSEPTIVEVPGMSAEKGEELCEKLTTLMYDRRVTLRHQWVEGDFIFNDNATTHHTRTAFESGHRELWRVHVN
ncbi:MAG: hypothetical protein L6R41_006245 [Letrouitia leprolyta]|nr:MAG: hypothetical protein L6R41_006245 [Letrouitia leprolyta]